VVHAYVLDKHLFRLEGGFRRPGRLRMPFRDVPSQRAYGTKLQAVEGAGEQRRFRPVPGHVMGLELGESGEFTTVYRTSEHTDLD
jgi:hypothetical protein